VVTRVLDMSKISNKIDLISLVYFYVLQTEQVCSRGLKDKMLDPTSPTSPSKRATHPPPALQEKGFFEAAHL